MNREKGFTISNSNSHCLLENWVEERSTKGYDAVRSEHELNKHGHPRLLTVKDDPSQSDTTYRVDYIEKDKNLPQRKYVGPACRREYLTQMFTQKAIAELQREEEEQIQRQLEERLQSETARSFWREQKLMQRPNISDHDLVKEQPITFWTEHHKHITGNTKIPNGMIDSPFRKNSSFSKPIAERYDDWACDTKYEQYK